MTLSEQVVENAVEEYMALMDRMDTLTEEAKKEMETATPERVKELEEKIGDIQAIREQLITSVKQSGISRDIIDQASRLLSIF